MEFSKYQGLGNDFLIVFEQEVTAEAATRMCDRHFGVGADGVIVLQRSDRADFSFQLFNSDGSIAEVSGNGLRCVGKYLYEKGYHNDSTLKVEAAGEVKLLELDIFHRTVRSVRADIGVGYELGEVELHGHTFKKVDTGNPHAVTFVDEIKAAPVRTIGPLVESDSHFPNKTNVEFAQVIGDKIHARFWERGAGHTLASGTGSSACLVASGLSAATVVTEGGELVIEKDDSGRLFMTGPAEHVFDGTLA